MLNYLYANFWEHHDFLKALQIGEHDLEVMIESRIIPKASYHLECDHVLTSFLGSKNEQSRYSFYLKSYVDWVQTVQSRGFIAEDDARSYFADRYFSTCKQTLANTLCQEEFPVLLGEIASQFDQNMFHSTWEYFLDGVYGICTRTGMPETVFLKQFYVKYIDAVTTEYSPDRISFEERERLRWMVKELDLVESDFAEHEVAQSSRQRCINRVRQVYLS